jgi:hypothetical protein
LNADQSLLDPFSPLPPPVDSLNVVGVIVSPGAIHAARIDMVRNHIAVIREFLFAERALAALKGDFLVHQLLHLCVGSEFPITAWMMRSSMRRTHICRDLRSLGAVSRPQQNRE